MYVHICSLGPLPPSTPKTFCQEVRLLLYGGSETFPPLFTPKPRPQMGLADARANLRAQSSLLQHHGVLPTLGSQELRTFSLASQRHVKL